jgi:hypothetical protein
MSLHWILLIVQNQDQIVKLWKAVFNTKHYKVAEFFLKELLHV